MNQKNFPLFTRGFYPKEWGDMGVRRVETPQKGALPERKPCDECGMRLLTVRPHTMVRTVKHDGARQSTVIETRPLCLVCYQVISGTP